ncbi:MULTISPECIES: glycoside hydrolase family 3 N-terminal domain-containing protein [Actinomyces]|uniref:Glycoside hydrolase family 3 C-terminal domain-containing protein n=1 Tax=Actinomyces respiraculi TaxID=2744574 RepID=A0A7T0LK53_9ACTO|nr:MULTISPECIES: glycoside hydrolase family 3 N-terminal domain-containing protein [Actinomyces]QPL05254.1 glycoside hydrolase family 3 C-terminal domain-containing protein [Actinomyces respiraculi]
MTANRTTPVAPADQLTDAQRARIEKILASLTWEEKLAQIQVTFKMTLDECLVAARSGIGALFWPGDAADTNAVQRAAVEESVHGIPLLIGLDVIHGQRTIFPIPLAMGASFTPASARSCAAVSAAEARSGGVSWTFSPMIDVARDPRWGRVAEGFGEDPLLTAAMGAAMVEGYQHERLSEPGTLVSTAKHYIGYGAAEGGRDYNTVDMSHQRLRSVYLPPFKDAVEAGVGSVMASFNTVNGRPVHANHRLLTDLLKDELGFTGAVVGDASGVENLVPHGVVTDLAEAATTSLLAGLDVEMGAHLYDPTARPESPALLVNPSPELVARVDDAVRRVLALKMALGLFDNPYVDADAEITAPTTDHLAADRAVAETCPVLLTNDGTLPIASTARRILLAGPAATHTDHLGAWVQHFAAPPAHGLDVALAQALARDAAARGQEPPALTVLGGQDPLGVTEEEVDAVATAAADADLVILALDEPSQLTGEATSRADLHLPGGQAALVHAAVATGTPVAVVLVAGRPLVAEEWIEEPGAVLMAWHLGTTAPEVIADILTGAVNPSGRLPIGFPRHSGQLPATYDAHENTGRPATRGGEMVKPAFDMGLDGPANLEEFFTSKYRDLELGPRFRFGHGLSYTSFEYRGAALSRSSVPVAELADGEGVDVTVTVTNTGDRDGDEVVLLFTRDVVASLAPAVRRLAGLTRVSLTAGQSTEVTLRLEHRHLALWDDDGAGWRVEPGDFEIRLGADPDATPLTLTVTA